MKIVLLLVLVLISNVYSAPTIRPSQPPTFAPTFALTSAPSQPPTFAPTFAPSQIPIFARTSTPSQPPTVAPTFAPSQLPTSAPTSSPTQPPVYAPTSAPTIESSDFSDEGDDTSTTGAPAKSASFTPSQYPTHAGPTMGPTTLGSVIGTASSTQTPTPTQYQTHTGPPSQTPGIFPSQTSPTGGNGNCGALNIDYFLDHCSSLWKPLPPIGANFATQSCPEVAIDQFLTKCSGLWPHAHTTVNSNKDGMDKLSKFEPASCEVLDIDEFLTECSDIYRYIDERFAALSHPEKAETVGVFDMFDMHSHSILVLSFVSNCILLFVSCWMMNTLRKYQRYQSYQTPVVYVESDSEQPFKQ